jgi:hypothetical protein
MAETAINVAPAAGQGAPVAALPLKLFSAPDGAGGLNVIQAVCITDDQGRAYLPMTEETGKELCSLMRQLLTTIVQNDGGFLPPDRGTSLDRS